MDFSRLRMGFELEFVSDHYVDALRCNFRRFLPRQFVNGFWEVKDDTTILTGSKRFSHEVASPVMGFEKAKNALHLCLLCLQYMEVETNYTCGLHINISTTSYKEMSGICPATLCAMVDEKKWMTIFRRQRNPYCCSQHKYIRNVSRRLADSPLAVKLDHIRDMLSEGADNAINIDKLCNNTDNPYVEFRMLGGKDYQFKWKQVTRAIDEFGRAVWLATNKDMVSAAVLNRRLMKIAQ